MKRFMPFYWPAGPASAVCAPSGKVSLSLGAISRNKLLMVAALALMSLGWAKLSYGQTVVNCAGGFARSTAGNVCQLQNGGSNPNGTGLPQFDTSGGGNPTNLLGTDEVLIPAGTAHNGYCMVWQQQVNVQAFTSTFTFIPDGYNVAFVLQNSNNNPTSGGGTNGAMFCSGAGEESGFYQYSQPVPPNNVFALQFDQYSSPDTSAATFTYSTVQIYQSGQNPGSFPKFSTSPVPLNNPAAARGTSTGDVYSATITYDGSNLTLALYDVTAGGSCPGTSCFTNTWTNVNIPSLVAGNTAWVEITGGQNLTITTPLSINSFTYAVGSPGPKPNPPTALSGSVLSH